MRCAKDTDLASQNAFPFFTVCSLGMINCGLVVSGKFPMLGVRNSRRDFRLSLTLEVVNLDALMIST